MLKKFTDLLRALGFKKDPPIETLAQLIDFIEGSSAYVSQVTLYTYVKARSGTQHPKLFENDDFLTSLRIARWHIFGACVADLTLFASAQFARSGMIDDGRARVFATDIIHHILHDYDQDDIPSERFTEMETRGKQRANVIDWHSVADGAAAFQSSSDAIYRWAPIADHLKQDDEEIIRNSLHLRWIGVRRDLKERLRQDSVLAGWSR